ncbi:putative short-chain dehydrogenase/reductase family 42E member 2 [Pelodytes ibericus]
MREKKFFCELEELRNRVEMEEICSECLKNTLPFRSASKQRPNGVLLHQSRALACTPSAHLGNGHSGITKALVTGGAGYVGHNLGCTLIKLGVSVVLFDIDMPEWEIPTGAVFIQSDVRDYDSLYKACEGVDCVFHVASIGMSGSQQLQKQKIESINIGGTKVVIDVCVQRNIPRLIYTSTVNVVFGGNGIEDGDETVPYLPLDKHLDHYSRTKAVADQMTLAANGSLLKDGNKLHTCVLRPPGIYGPDERRHLPRLAMNVERRLLCFKFASRSTKMNWIHLCNLVEAHLLAAKALTASKGFIASGKAYYIHDGENVNLFEWLHPLFEKLGFRDPWLTLPSSFVYTAACLLEYVHIALKPIWNLNPLLTRIEVAKIAVTHTFRIDKARRELGFNPKKFSFADSVDYYVKSRRKSKQEQMIVYKLFADILYYCAKALASTSLVSLFLTIDDHVNSFVNILVT